MSRTAPNLETLYSPASLRRDGGTCIRLDVVLVHGFGANPEGTWTEEESNKCWPRDHVPNNMKQHTRVVMFKYSETTMRPYQRNHLSGHAKRLLGCLRQCPQRRKNGPLRPIVWVAHSIGGIIVKEALMIAMRTQHFLDIFNSTRGVLFFATPHHKGSSWDDIVAKIFEKAPCYQFFGLKASSRVLLGKEDSAGLDNIAREFASFSNSVMGFKLASFEEEATSVLGSNSNNNLNAEVMSLPRDHFDICKLREDDEELAMVWRIIKRMGDRLPQTTSLGHSDLRALEGLGIARMRIQSVQQQRTAGTCDWIEFKQFFKDWREKSNPERLWVYGGLGSGKTYLTRHIVELLGSDGAVAYCSLNDIVTSYKTPKSILVWLMYEILRARRELIAECLTRVYEQERESKGDNVCDWPLENVKGLWKALMKSLMVDKAGRKHGTLHVVIDGVDQCLGGSRELKNLKEFFVCITDGPVLQLLVFSRPSSDFNTIQRDHEFKPYLMRENDTRRDISTTVREGAHRIAIECDLDKTTEEQVVKKVEEKAKGMYLWASVVLGELKRDRITKEDLLELLDNLPESIIELYDFILGRATALRAQNSGSEVKKSVNIFTKRVLFWIAYQVQAMDEGELWTGVSLVRAVGLPPRGTPRGITEGDVGVLSSAENLERKISRACGALVTFTDDDAFVPSHPTVGQFLVTPTEKLKDIYPNLKHHEKYYCGGLSPDDIIRQLCTNYLLLRRFSEPENHHTHETWAAKVEARVAEHPFGRYAACNWLKHAHKEIHPTTTNSAGNPEFAAGSDGQRLLQPAHNALHDIKCSRSWIEIWWYFEKPGLEFPADGVVPLEDLRSGAVPPERFHWHETRDAVHDRGLGPARNDHSGAGLVNNNRVAVADSTAYNGDVSGSVAHSTDGTIFANGNSDLGARPFCGGSVNAGGNLDHGAAGTVYHDNGTNALLPSNLGAGSVHHDGVGRDHTPEIGLSNGENGEPLQQLQLDYTQSSKLCICCVLL